MHGEKGKCRTVSTSSMLQDNTWSRGKFRTFTISNGQTGSDHVGVPDGFHLVNVVALDARIEQLVDRVEERHHLEEKLTFVIMLRQCPRRESITFHYVPRVKWEIKSGYNDR